MKTWKAVAGVGAACAACCAVPLLGGAALWAAGTSTLAAVGAALVACADDLVPLGAVTLAVMAAGGFAWWRRRAVTTPPACVLDPNASRETGQSCKCPPGACR
jgi:hypothetical protein